MKRIFPLLISHFCLSVNGTSYDPAHTCINNLTPNFIEYMIRHDTCPARASDFDGIANLKEELLRHGGVINKCDVHTFDGGMRGIIATKDI